MAAYTWTRRALKVLMRPGGPRLSFRYPTGSGSIPVIRGHYMIQKNNEAHEGRYRRNMTKMLKRINRQLSVVNNAKKIEGSDMSVLESATCAVRQEEMYYSASETMDEE